MRETTSRPDDEGLRRHVTDALVAGRGRHDDETDDAGEEAVDDEEQLPPMVRRELGAIRAGLAVRTADEGPWVRVPVVLAGTPVGALAGLHGLAADPSDLTEQLGVVTDTEGSARSRNR